MWFNDVNGVHGQWGTGFVNPWNNLNWNPNSCYTPLYGTGHYWHPFQNNYNFNTPQFGYVPFNTNMNPSWNNWLQNVPQTGNFFNGFNQTPFGGHGQGFTHPLWNLCR